jgi:hypothetical protein
MKRQLPALCLMLLFIIGSLKSFVLPLIRLLWPSTLGFIRIQPWVGLDSRLAVPFATSGILPLIGIGIFVFKGKQLEKREGFSWHVVLGSLLAICGLLTPAYYICQNPSFAAFATELFNMSELPFWGLALGLSLALYKLEKASLLLGFFLPMALLWVIYPVTFALEHLKGLASAGFYAYGQRFWTDVNFYSEQAFRLAFGWFVLWSSIRLKSKKNLNTLALQ